MGQGDRIAAQSKALETLLKVCDDPEWVVRYAAVTGLEALGQALDASLVSELPKLRQRLAAIAAEDDTLALQARAQLALQRLSAP